MCPGQTVFEIARAEFEAALVFPGVVSNFMALLCHASEKRRATRDPAADQKEGRPGAIKRQNLQDLRGNELVWTVIKR
jgi:hypothetical protein